MRIIRFSDDVPLWDEEFSVCEGIHGTLMDVSDKPSGNAPRALIDLAIEAAENGFNGIVIRKSPVETKLSLALILEDE